MHVYPDYGTIHTPLTRTSLLLFVNFLCNVIQVLQRVHKAPRANQEGELGSFVPTHASQGMSRPLFTEDFGTPETKEISSVLG